MHSISSFVDSKTHMIIKQWPINRAAVGAMLRAPLLSRQLAYGDGLNHSIPAEVVDGGGGADPIVVDVGPGVSVARGAGGESSAPHCVRFGPVLRG